MLGLHLSIAKNIHFGMGTFINFNSSAFELPLFRVGAGPLLVCKLAVQCFEKCSPIRHNESHCQQKLFSLRTIMDKIFNFVWSLPYFLMINLICGSLLAVFVFTPSSPLPSSHVITA